MLKTGYLWIVNNEVFLVVELEAETEIVSLINLGHPNCLLTDLI